MQISSLPKDKNTLQTWDTCSLMRFGYGHSGYKLKSVFTCEKYSLLEWFWDCLSSSLLVFKPFVITYFNCNFQNLFIASLFQGVSLCSQCLSYCVFLESMYGPFMAMHLTCMHFQSNWFSSYSHEIRRNCIKYPIPLSNHRIFQIWKE